MSRFVPMAVRPRRQLMTLRDWIDAALVVALLIAVAYAAGLFVPVAP